MNKEIVIDDLHKVLFILIDENKWCKRALARDEDDNQLFDPRDLKACKWCIYGVLYGTDCSQDTINYLKNFAKMWGSWPDLDRLNDLNEHFYVVQFLQSALYSAGGTFRLKYPLLFSKGKKK